MAQGSTPLENGTAQIPYYGYDGNGPHLPPLASTVEATKTEPDKNTYLVFQKGLSGPDAMIIKTVQRLRERGAPGHLVRYGVGSRAC